MNGVPGPLESKKRLGGIVPKSQPHLSPILLCLPLCTSISPDPHPQAQNRKCGEQLAHKCVSILSLDARCMEGWGGQYLGPLGETTMGRRSSHKCCVKTDGYQACYCQDSHAGFRDGVGLSPGWAGAGIETQSQTRKGVTAGQCRRKDKDSDSAAHLPPTRTIASMVRIWLKQVRVCSQPLHCPWSKLKQALVAGQPSCLTPSGSRPPSLG